MTTSAAARLLDLTGRLRRSVDPMRFPWCSTWFKALALAVLVVAVVLAFTTAIISVPLLLVTSYYCWRKGDLCAATALRSAEAN